MRFPYTTSRNIYLDPGAGEGGGGGSGGDNQEGQEKPFSVSKEDWESTQNELNTLRGERERFSNVEREFGSMKERFKPFLEGSNEQADARPDRSKYGTGADAAEKFVEDLAAWKFRNLQKEVDSTRNASQREQQEAQRETEAINTLVTAHSKRVADVSKSVPDFDKVVSNGIINFQQHAPLAKAILKLKNSAMVEYNLAKNPQAAMQLIRTAAVDLDEAKEVLFGLNHQYSEDAKKSAARRQAERGGNFGPTEEVNGEMQASGDDASDEDFVRKSLGLKAKK